MKDVSSVAWPFVGQEAVLHYLHTFLLQERWAAALLFHGPAHLGKATCARLFLQAALCHTKRAGFFCGRCVACTAWKKGQHPDLHLLKADGADESLGIEAIRTLQRDLSLQPALGSYRTALIERADRLTPEAANALLKTLEEPLPQTIIVLTADALNSLPATLRSRMQTLAFQPVPQKMLYHAVRQRTDDEALALHVSSAAAGRPGIAFTFLADREVYAAYCADAELCIRVMQTAMPQRWTLARTALGAAGSTEAVRQRARQIIAVWSGVVRDLLFVRERCQEFITHRFLMTELLRTAERYSTLHLARLLRRLEDARVGLTQYLNPQFLLEHYLLYV